MRYVRITPFDPQLSCIETVILPDFLGPKRCCQELKVVEQYDRLVGNIVGVCDINSNALQAIERVVAGPVPAPQREEHGAEAVRIDASLHLLSP